MDASPSGFDVASRFSLIIGTETLPHGIVALVAQLGFKVAILAACCDCWPRSVLAGEAFQSRMIIDEIGCARTITRGFSAAASPFCAWAAVLRDCFSIGKAE